MHETRIGYFWKRTEQTPLSTEPSLQVAGFFVGGGSSAGDLNDRERNLEADDDVMLTRGRHTLKFGLQSLGLFIHQTLWIEAANKYVVVHTAAGSHVARQTIQNLQDKLDPEQFVRIHRSTLVRKSAVRGLHPLFHGDYIVKLVNGAEITLSRNFRASFFHEMGA